MVFMVRVREVLMSQRLIIDARVEISFEDIFSFFNLFFVESENNDLNAVAWLDLCISAQLNKRNHQTL